MNKYGMKTILATLTIMLLFGLTVRAENYSVTVTTSSTVLVPKAAVHTAATWTNNHVVAQGAYVANTNTPPYTYFAVTAGTSTNMPTHVYGIDTSTDAVEWLKLPSNRRRLNVVIFADTATEVYYNADGVAATTAGAVLDALRPVRGFPGEGGEVKGIVASGTATVNVELSY